MTTHANTFEAINLVELATVTGGGEKDNSGAGGVVREPYRYPKRVPLGDRSDPPGPGYSRP